MLDRDLETYETLFQRRQQKELLVKGAAKFDENPKAGLVYLEGIYRMVYRPEKRSGLIRTSC